MKSRKFQHNNSPDSGHSRSSSPTDFSPEDEYSQAEDTPPPTPPHFKGRGTASNPPIRFEKINLEAIATDSSAPAADSLEFRYSADNPEEPATESRGPKTEFWEDASESIVTENHSPDLSYRWSINPYRGCEHGCTYCYARPYHEYLGLSAGLDFEQKIIVKARAPQLLKQWLSKPAWKGERLALSGVTDPYQPIERQLKITRQILELMVETKHCVTLITKNSLIHRDIDLLAQLSAWQLTGVAISLTTLDAELARKMEPRTASPVARLRTVKQLSEAGIPVHVNLAPMIPGLTDHEIPQLLQAAKDQGAISAGMQIVRLPGAVEEIFSQWLATEFPEQQAKILGRIQAMHAGKLNDSRFGTRMRGDGPLAEHLQQTFRLWAKRCHLDGGMPKLNETLFTPPAESNGQLRLF